MHCCPDVGKPPDHCLCYLCRMRTLFIIAVLWPLAGLQAQTPEPVVKRKKHKTITYVRQPVQTYPVTAGWISPIGWHMGLYAQTDYLLQTKTVEKQVFRLFGPRRRTRTFTREVAVIPGLMWYTQPEFHGAAAVYAQVALRRMRKPRVSYQVAGGLARIQTWYHGPVYDFDKGSDPVVRNLGGRGYTAPGISFSMLAKHGHRKTGVPKGYVDLNVSAWFPAGWGQGPGMLLFWGAGWRMPLTKWKGGRS